MVDIVDTNSHEKSHTGNNMTTNETIKKEMEILLERENISFFAFSIYLEPSGDDDMAIKSVIVSVGGEALSPEERFRAAGILIDLGRRLREQATYNTCKHCEHSKGEHSYDECMALVNGKKCACRGYEETE